MHNHYYDTSTSTVNGWQVQAAPSERFPYGLGLDNDGYLISLGVYPFREEKQDHDPATQELAADDAPIIEGGEAVLYFRPVALPQEVITEKYAVAIREERDKRIAATDYLMAADYPLTDAARAGWAAYRQALRDIPAQPGFPWAGPGDPSCPWPMAEEV